MNMRGSDNQRLTTKKPRTAYLPRQMESALWLFFTPESHMLYTVYDFLSYLFMVEV